MIQPKFNIPKEIIVPPEILSPPKHQSTHSISDSHNIKQPINSQGVDHHIEHQHGLLSKIKEKFDNFMDKTHSVAKNEVTGVSNLGIGEHVITGEPSPYSHIGTMGMLDQSGMYALGSIGIPTRELNIGIPSTNVEGRSLDQHKEKSSIYKEAELI